jgi:thiol-disulfide isomerase/thioredoxin
MYKHILLIFLFHLSAFSQVQLLNFKELTEKIAADTAKHKVVNFWATWCVPCVAELPYFSKIDSVYRAQGIKVWLVSLDAPSQLKTKVIPFVKRRKITLPVILLNETNPNDWIDKTSPGWSGAIPATWFLNTKNQTNYFHVGECTYEELEKLVQANLRR